MLRVIREVQPRYIVGENVRGLISWDGGLVFDTVCSDLEAEGYEVLPVLLPAASVNAPHKRDRIWFIAKNTKCNGRIFGESEKVRTNIRKFGDIGSRSSDGIYLQKRDSANTENVRRENALENEELERGRFRQSYKRNAWDTFPSVTPICIGDDGVSNKLDGITVSKWRKESIKGAGNAIVPQLAFEIFKTIEQCEHFSSTASKA